MPDYESKKTKDINKVKKWAEKRGGRPAVVVAKDTKTELLRFDFGEEEQNLQEISWDEFEKIFKENDLTFLYQDELKHGGLSRFFKFVSE